MELRFQVKAPDEEHIEGTWMIYHTDYPRPHTCTMSLGCKDPVGISGDGVMKVHADCGFSTKCKREVTRYYKYSHAYNRKIAYTASCTYHWPSSIAFHEITEEEYLVAQVMQS